jgi:hypothetical protein
VTICGDNHYVPCVYLKRFAPSPERVWKYRLVVADARVPLWKLSAIKGVAYHRHLYTRIASGSESDEVERWLNDEFETPAEDALWKSTSDMRLTPTDWCRLIRFLAAQDVRTPARMGENFLELQRIMPNLLQDSLSKSVRTLEQAGKSGRIVSASKESNSQYLPIRLRREIIPGQKFGTITAETVVGRGYFLFFMRHMLTQNLKILLGHKWTILRPPSGLSWFTSDDPVVKVNYDGPGKYDFKGTWGNKGTEIFLPLDQHHLLYTKVGVRPPHRGWVLPRELAETIRCLIAEHAHRFIFAKSTEDFSPELRSRIVNPDLLREENDQWQRWHQEQTAAELELMKGALPSH